MENLPESPKYDAKHWATINGMKNHEKVFITVMITKQLLTKNYRTILSANTSPIRTRMLKVKSIGIKWLRSHFLLFFAEM